MARPHSDQAKIAEILDVMEVSGALKGVRVSVTGHLGLPRDEVIAIVKKAGGEYDPRPKFGTTYLVTNADWTKGTIKGKVSSKYEEARRNGIKIITEQELYDLIVQKSTG